MEQEQPLQQMVLGDLDSYMQKMKLQGENQDGGVGRHTEPPRATRTDRKSNSKEVQHQVNKKEISSRPVGGAETAAGAERTRVAMAGPRLAECGTNRAGSLTTSRPCNPTLAQINPEGRTQSGGEQGRQSSG